MSCPAEARLYWCFCIVVRYQFRPSTLSAAFRLARSASNWLSRRVTCFTLKHRRAFSTPQCPHQDARCTLRIGPSSDRRDGLGRGGDAIEEGIDEVSLVLSGFPANSGRKIRPVEAWFPLWSPPSPPETSRWRFTGLDRDPSVGEQSCISLSAFAAVIVRTRWTLAPSMEIWNRREQVLHNTATASAAGRNAGHR